MKLSPATIDVLKNFSEINSGLVFKPGNQLRTISANKVVYAEAKVDESFPREFGIYDLSKLLGVLSLHESADLNFGDASLDLAGVNGRSKTRIRYTETALIPQPPAKGVNISNYEVNFKLVKDDLAWVGKVGAVLGCPNIVVANDNGRVVVSAIDVKGEIVDDSALDVGEYNDGTPFKFVLKVENIKLLPGDYDVSIAAKGVARFVGKSATYFIATEQSSSFYGESKGE